MTKMKMHQIALATALASAVLAAAAVAAAETANGPSGRQAHDRCSGEHGASTPAEREQRGAERFQKADKNGDGFLTEDEVGARRWEHLKIADADSDGKISLAEMQQAHRDGKLGHHGRGRGGDDKGTRS
jgi:hypothetical protein